MVIVYDNWSDYLKEKIEELKEDGLTYKEIYNVIEIFAMTLEELKMDITCDVIVVGNKWLVKTKKTSSSYKTFDNELYAYRKAKIYSIIHTKG